MVSFPVWKNNNIRQSSEVRRYIRNVYHIVNTHLPQGIPLLLWWFQFTYTWQQWVLSVSTVYAPLIHNSFWLHFLIIVIYSISGIRVICPSKHYTCMQMDRFTKDLCNFTNTRAVPHEWQTPPEVVGTSWGNCFVKPSLCSMGF